MTQLCWPRGLRPRAARGHRFASAQLFAAVCPERGRGIAPVLPEADKAAMNLPLAELGQALPARAHAVPVLDRAGRHKGDALPIPGNLTRLHLPSRAPELDPVEKVWPYPRDRWLGHLLLPEGEAVRDAAGDACRAWCAEPRRPPP